MSSGFIDVNEIFGPTVQGEGAAAGRHCLFLRLAHCNLECSWCDTPYTWAWSEAKAAKTVSGIVHSKSANVHSMTVDEIITDLEKLWPIYEKPTIIVISGGEPLIQAKNLEPLLQRFCNLNCPVHIETAGTLKPTEYLDLDVAQYNVSPKLNHSGNRLSKRHRPDVLKWFANRNNAWFKFVAKDTKDFKEIDAIVETCNIKTSNVMIMPEGITVEDNVKTGREIAQAAIDRGYGISFRLHILLWKDVRGR